MSKERKFQIQNDKFQINDNIRNHKYQKSRAGSGTILTAVPILQSFLPRGQAPWGIIFGANSFLVFSRYNHGDKPHKR